jgi:hypothetical protein
VHHAPPTMKPTHFFQNFQTIDLSVRCDLKRDVSWEFYDCIIKLGLLISAVLYLFSKNSWIVIGFGLDCQSKKNQIEQ